MDKKVVIISASLRKDSNSERLAKAFAQGAERAENEIEFISLSGKKLGFCTGCLSCQKTFRCYMQDDAAVIAEKIKNADERLFMTWIVYVLEKGKSDFVKEKLSILGEKYDAASAILYFKSQK